MVQTGRAVAAKSTPFRIAEAVVDQRGRLAVMTSGSVRVPVLMSMVQLT
jgi:hypothetical protein